LVYQDLKKELVFKNPCFFLILRCKIKNKTQEASRFAVALVSKNLKKNKKCNGELEKACNYVHKHLLLMLTEKIVQTTSLC